MVSSGREEGREVTNFPEGNIFTKTRTGVQDYDRLRVKISIVKGSVCRVGVLHLDYKLGTALNDVVDDSAPSCIQCSRRLTPLLSWDRLFLY